MFYLLWHTVAGNNAAVGGVWALILGLVAALVRFFVGSLVDPSGFGLSRWMSGCIDIVVLPALAPLVVYFALIFFKIISGTADFANFALLWLIPGAIIRSVSWSSLQDPILLILAPVLWTAIAVGVPFFINLIQNSHRLVIIPASLAIIIIPYAAANSYWAFFSQKNSLGILFLFVSAAPMLVSMTLSFIRGDY